MEKQNIQNQGGLGAEGLDRGDLVEELIRRYRPMVYAAARRVAPWLRQDEDLLQCGLIGLWKAAEQWDEARPFPALARRCIENEMVTYLRRQQRQGYTVPLDWLGETAACYEVDWSAAETRAEVERITGPHSRDRALLLAVADGYSPAEAARRLGISRQTAARKLRRAGRRLGLTVAKGKEWV